MKRRSGPNSEEAAAGSKKPHSKGGFFDDMHLILHPAALSTVRRTIFQQQINKNGGKWYKSLQEAEEAGVTSEVVVLIEDNLLELGNLEAIANKIMKDAVASNLQVSLVGLSWLSKCLEEETILDRRKYTIKVAKSEDDEEERNQNHTVKMAAIETEKQGQRRAGNHANEKISFIDRNRHKFVCAQSSANSSSTDANLNRHITDELEKLAKAYKSSNDTWRAFGYQKAIAALKRHPERITTRGQAAAIPNVGRKMADKIVEIIEDGRLQKVSEVCESERMKTLALFNKVWGVGPATAEKWYERGLRSLGELEQCDDLTRQQKVGLKHFADLDERMDRSEAEMIYEFVKNASLSIQSGLEVIACGSFRRGKPTCGDLDILITHEDSSALEGLFDKLLRDLRHAGFLTDDLSVQKDGLQRKYLGVCRLPQVGKHRRLDIIVVPYEERASALMYFTGSAHFNRSMRLLATKIGMSLSEHALVRDVLRSTSDREKLNEGVIVPTPTEESIFEALGLPYRPPNERDH